MNYWPNKHPQEILDYMIDWSARLKDDVINTVEWVIPVGLTVVSTAKTDSVTTAWLSGGAANARYTVICRIVTLEGRKMEQTVGLNIH